MPVYATEIDEVVLYRNEDKEPLDEVDPTCNPGDTIYVNIRSFKIDEEIYGLEDNVTFTDYALVLDSTSLPYASTDSSHTSIIIKGNLTADNPVIKFTIVIIQPGAPSEYRNLIKEISVKVYIPVTSFEVVEKNGKQSGYVDRNQTFEYNIKYNSNNVASIKGYKTTLYNRNNQAISSSPYFSIVTNSPYSFKLTISKNAPFESYVKVVIASVDNPALKYTFVYDVKLLEASYQVKYSRDYQGSTNPGTGIQLVETNNLTQLRTGYKADITFVGTTTGKTYTPTELRNYGLIVEFPYNYSSYFSVSSNGVISMSTSAPAYTSGNRTVYWYDVKITDGTRVCTNIRKEVEVYKPLSGSSYSNFYLSGPETVYSGGNVKYTSYSLIFDTQGTFSATRMDLNYNTNDSYFKVTKNYSSNSLTFSTSYPEYVGDTITITVTNGLLYNNVNIDSSWKQTMTVNRRFIASSSQLAKVKNDVYSSYRMVKNITYYNWTPIPEFYGSFDGVNYQLTITIYQDSGNIGFVGINYGTIKNMNIKARIFSYSTDTTNWRYVGAVAGKNYGTIDYCYINRYFSDESYYTVEQEEGRNVYYYHNVDLHVGGNTDLACVGGIAGTNTGNITNCRNYTNIYSRGDMGGIAGRSNGYIYNSDNSGRIFYLYWEANRSIGGIVGYQYGGTIDWCYNYGTISYDNLSSDSRSLQPKMGRIVGHKEGTVTRYNSSGTVDIGTLHTVGIWPFTWNQAKYAGNRAFGLEE